MCGYKTLLSLISFLFLLVILGEIIMRSIGFCNSPLFYNDYYTGYNLVPNQNVKRFGNEYITNEYSMRSYPLKDGEYRILLVGDSVLNGGVQTDHSSLATTILEEKYSSKYRNVRILNLSCGGWGIDNDAGVFQKNGLFDGKMIVLVLNSHDAVGTINRTDIAGNDVNFPDRQYYSAWIELFDRYLIPRVKNILQIRNNTVNSTNTSEGNEYSSGWEYFYKLCRDNKIPLVIYLHADKEEMESGEYSDNGKWIIDFANDRNILLITDINEIHESDYRDGIHLSEEGQHVINDLLDPVIGQFLSETLE